MCWVVLNTGAAGGDGRWMFYKIQNSTGLKLVVWLNLLTLCSHTQEDTQEFGRNPRQARRAEQSPCLLFQVISADSHSFLYIQHVLYNPDIYDLHRIQQMTSDLQCDL